MKNAFIQEHHYNEEFFHANTSVKGTFLNIELMGITRTKPTYYISRRNEWDIYIFEYVLDGVGYIKCNGNKYKVKKGDTYLIRNFTEHEYYPDPNRPYQKLWINASGSLFDHLLKLFNLSDDVIVRHVDISDLFYQLRDQLNTEYNNTEAVACTLFQMLMKLSNTFNPSEKQNLNLAEQMQRYIDKNLHNNISTIDVAEEFRINPVHANRVFKAQYGKPINQYIIEATLALATQWLKTSNYSIGEIATMLNFCSSKYFSNQFKAHYGCSPKQYQLRYKKKDYES